jgi:lipoate-protein ligase A
MPNIVRTLSLECRDGAANMAADEVLLQAAVAGSAALRFYTWREPTVSMGYFQPHEARNADPRLTALPWVRRTSGGAALVHHHELTYCLALPAGPAWQPRGQSWICRMHGIIAKALSSFAIEAQSVNCGAEKKADDVLCFLQHAAGDLLIRGHKVAGSAQRKQRGALMQHGGILLSRSPYTLALPGIRELAGIAIAPERLVEALLPEVQRQTGWSFEARPWRPEEETRIRELAAKKFGHESWNCKR